MTTETENGAPAAVAITTEATTGAVVLVTRRSAASKRRPRRRAKAPKLPTMGRHSSGQARVTLNGKVHYLGAFGTLAAQQAYAELLAKWESNGRRPLDPTPDCMQVGKVRDVFDAFTSYVDDTKRYTKDGVPTAARRVVQVAIDEFLKSFGDVPVRNLSDVLLVQHRDWLERRVHLTRGGINKKMGLLRAALKWAKQRGHITRAQWLTCNDVEPLTKAECGGRDQKRPKRAVTLAEVEQVAAVAPPQVARMLRVQAAIGCRPGEIARMNWNDISTATTDVDGTLCRVYTVRGAKNEHHGKGSTTYALPPGVVELLGTPSAPGAFVFPSPVTGRGYNSHAYRNAIARACVRAGIPSFGPHCVRHGFLTRAANRYGVLAAAAAANHSDTRTTATYLHQSRVDGYRCVVGLAAK